MKVSAFTFIKNGQLLGYPFLQSIQSVLPIVDEFIVNVGESEDDTLALVQSIANSKIRIIKSRWNETMQDCGYVYGQQKMIAHYNCTGDWAFYVEGDEVYHENELEKIEDESGKTVLSKEKAEFLSRWKDLRNIHETGEIIKGQIIRRIKGGMVVDLSGVQAFLPGSQIDIRPVKDFDQYINKEIDLRVVKFNEMRKNVVVSHKAIIEDTLAEQRDELFSKLEVGNVIDGRVKNITDFEAKLNNGNKTPATPRDTSDKIFFPISDVFLFKKKLYG